MRNFKTAISFTIMAVITVLVLGLCSLHRNQQPNDGAAQAPETDHPIMLCI